MTHCRRIGVLAVIIGLALAGCTTGDDDADDISDVVGVVEAVENAELDPEQARCVLDRFEDADFSQETLSDIAEAESPAEYPEGTADQIDAIVRHCTVTIDDLVDAVEDAGLGPEQARCVGDGFADADFSQETLGDLAEADTSEEFPERTAEVIESILAQCR